LNRREEEEARYSQPKKQIHKNNTLRKRVYQQQERNSKLVADETEDNILLI